MRMLEVLVVTAGAQALGYALARFLWEGALTACLATLALRCFHSSHVRYGVVCVGLVAMPVASALRFGFLPQPCVRTLRLSSDLVCRRSLLHTTRQRSNAP